MLEAAESPWSMSSSTASSETSVVTMEMLPALSRLPLSGWMPEMVDMDEMRECETESAEPADVVYDDMELCESENLCRGLCCGLAAEERVWWWAKL